MKVRIEEFVHVNRRNKVTKRYGVKFPNMGNLYAGPGRLGTQPGLLGRVNVVDADKAYLFATKAKARAWADKMKYEVIE